MQHLGRLTYAALAVVIVGGLYAYASAQHAAEVEAASMTALAKVGMVFQMPPADGGDDETRGPPPAPGFSDHDQPATTRPAAAERPVATSGGTWDLREVAEP